MHIHFRVVKDGINQMLKDGQLSDDAKRAIAGLMTLAPSITAFGNTNPTSYFRLVPHQEAPTNICWGDRNRSVLVRVPLGWTSKKDLCAQANPGEKSAAYDTSQKQTVEMRSPDGSADIFLLLAGLAVACRYGFESADALEVAEKTYVNVNIHKDENKALLDSLNVLPDSCAASADCLEAQRAFYEKDGIFSPAMIDGLIASLRKFDDRTLRQDIGNDQAKILELVEKYFHC
jgi:glutamine synthetase